MTDTHDTITEKTPAESPKKGTHGGARAGAGKTLGSATGMREDGVRSAAKVITPESIAAIPDYIRNMSMLDILREAAYQFAYSGQWAAAASCAEKAAKYTHTPIAAKAVEKPTDPKHMTDQQLLEAAQVVNLKKAA